MNIEAYEDPTDPYAPRPKASQTVAAAKRATQSHDSTAPITPIIQRRRFAIPFGIGAAVLITLMIAAASYQLARLPGRPLAITPAHAFNHAQEATSAPISAPMATIPTVAMVSAYAAPDGLLLGQIESTRQITPVAHYGTIWIAYQDGAGLVWLRSSDRPDLALAGPDLAPVAAQPAQTGRGLTVDTIDWTPPAASAAPPAEPTIGQKDAPDRAARHAAAVARDHETHRQKVP